MPNPASASRAIGLLALATGGVLIAGILCLIVFYAIGGPWGTVNDAGNAVAALLSAALAWRLHRQSPARSGGRALALACLGALIAVYGSHLVMSSRTGWYLAGLYTSLGYALIGVWLWRASGSRSTQLPRGLARLGRFTGAFMALGVLAAPGLLAGIDSPLTAPWWAHAGFVGGLGWVLVYPVWCLWLGRVLAAPGTTRPVSAPDAVAR